MPLVAKYINAYLSTIKYLNEMVAVPVHSMICPLNNI